jgi:hypothetical protein
MHEEIFNESGINSLNFNMSGLMNDDHLYNLVYEAIMSHPTYVIVSESNSSRKIQIIGNMIKYFEEREDYEKCYDLLNIKKEIQEKC